jgi:RNA polymerase sigma-70 factor (ECF subfamily)
VLNRRRRLSADPRVGAPDRQLRALIDDHADAIFRMAFSVLRDRGLAEDVVQETLITAWRRLPEWRGDGSLQGWVLSIAHNTSVSYLRRIRDDATEPSRMPEHAAPDDVERHVGGRADLEALTSALAGLDDISRSVVVLRDIEGLSYQEIADVLGLPLPTIKTRLLRARRELQRVLHQGALT